MCILWGGRIKDLMLIFSSLHLLKKSKNGFQIYFFCREDQADEYRDLKKELEQTAKNCRILQFKLRKAERRVEQVEAEKVDLENRLQVKNFKFFSNFGR